MQSIEERAAAAYELKATGKCNCSQSVVKVFQDKLPVGEDTHGKATPRISKELLQKFESKCGATICNDLKGIGTGKPLCPCPECVRNAVLALGEVFPD